MKILLKHKGYGCWAFDWLVTKDELKKFFIQKLKAYLYDASECKYVKKFLKEHPEMKLIYIGSEDLGYLEEINESVSNIINKSIKYGFKIVVMEEIE